MMMVNEVSFGKWPLIAVLAALITGQLFGGYVLWAVSTKQAMVQVPEVTHVAVATPKYFDESYHLAVGQRFVWSLGNWNRWNVSRQIGLAMQLADAGLVPALRLRYAQYNALANRMRVARRTNIEDAASNWSDATAGTSQHRYLVRIDEWWSGSPQVPQWEQITLQMISRSSSDAGWNPLAKVTGMSVVNITKTIMAERGYTAEGLRRELELDLHLRLNSEPEEAVLVETVAQEVGIPMDVPSVSPAVDQDVDPVRVEDRMSDEPAPGQE